MRSDRGEEEETRRGEERRGEDRREEEKATDIKSNNPHLAGGENTFLSKPKLEVENMLMKFMRLCGWSYT